ncbi:hypothetical protein T492DRAFT_863760 [Pavlovales sp. CCMP2436]|nr:hypothetical protein T492DRAFT_863760 [Pavlovales sp. CCMP2436]
MRKASKPWYMPCSAIAALGCPLNLSIPTSEGGSTALNHDALGRLGPIALVDLAGTLLIAGALARTYRRPLLPALAGALLLGEAVHLALSIETPITRALTGPP